MVEVTPFAENDGFPDALASTLRMFYGTLWPRFADPGHHALNGAYFVVYFVCLFGSFEISPCHPCLILKDDPSWGRGRNGSWRPQVFWEVWTSHGHGAGVCAATPLARLLATRWQTCGLRWHMRNKRMSC